MSDVAYITTIEQVIAIHSKTVEHSGGGDHGQLELGKLESVLQHIQNDDYYPSFADKLTHLFFSTCQFHCFTDGNKRLAITLSTYFLIINGYMAIAKDFMAITENISYYVAAGRISKALLHRIMEAIMNGTYQDDETLKLEILSAIQ